MSGWEIAGELEVTYTQFWIIDNEEWPPERPDRSSNGLIAGKSRGAMIMTGIHTGPVDIKIEVLDQPATESNLDDWDDVVEISFPAPAGLARVVSLEDNLKDSPLVTRNGPGDYRVRVHVRGRDANPDGTTEEPSEYYYLIFWPERFRAETIHKATDMVGHQRRERPDRRKRRDTQARIRASLERIDPEHIQYAQEDSE